MPRGRSGCGVVVEGQAFLLGPEAEEVGDRIQKGAERKGSGLEFHALGFNFG